MKKIDYFIKKYLENRPMFMAIIRSQEAMLFQKNNKLIRGKILDFGCGDGFFTKLVFGKNRINVGLDLFSNKRVEEAKKEKIYKKISLYDSNTIPYPDNSFNTIISNCVLEHIPNLEFSLKEIYRILKPGGYFLTTVMTDRWNYYLLGKKIFSNRYVKYMNKKQDHYNLFSYEKWLNKFNQSGFKTEKIIGYLNEKNSCFMDLAHYLSLPSLITYKLFKNWQIFPKLTTLIWKSFIIKNINIKVDLNKSSALFFCLYK